MFGADRRPVNHLSVDELNAVSFSEYAGRNHFLVTIDTDSGFFGDEGHAHRCALLISLYDSQDSLLQDSHGQSGYARRPVGGVAPQKFAAQWAGGRCSDSGEDIGARHELLAIFSLSAVNSPAPLYPPTTKRDPAQTPQ